MAGTIQPIAALTPDDHGPLNTIASIILSVSSVFFTTIRIVTHGKKGLRYEVDDLVFGAALVSANAFRSDSVLAHRYST